MPTLRPTNLAVLISGAGTTLDNFIQQIDNRQLDAQVSLVIASTPASKGLQRAQAAQVPTQVIDRKAFEDVAAFSHQIFAAIEASAANLVCLAGWLCLLKIPDQWAGRVINIHPSLLPKFGGKGMYGHKVHQAVIASHCTISGCTVHYVDDEYDNGPIILQRSCPVLPTDTPATLAARVFQEEKLAYPQAIRHIQTIGSLQNC